MGLRTAIVTFRSEPRRRKRNYPQVSGPQPVDVNTQYAPQPVAYTQFSTMGRDAAHALPRQWLYQSLAIPEWSSVAAPFFLPGMHAQPSAQLTVSMPKGWFTPIGQRTDIEPNPQVSLASLTSIKAPVVVNNATYAKLVG